LAGDATKGPSDGTSCSGFGSSTLLDFSLHGYPEPREIRPCCD
jgi:hypothetical protein